MSADETARRSAGRSNVGGSGEMAGPARPQPGKGPENRARWREPAGEETVAELGDVETPRVRVCRCSEATAPAEEK